MGADRESDLRFLVQELGDLVGEEVPTWRDGHTRWGLYERVGTHAEAKHILRRAVAIEPDPSVASAVVVMMLGRIDPEERDQWVAMLDPAVRRFSQVRSRELGILELLHSDETLNSVDSHMVQSWSDWLQRKVVESVRDDHVLSVLSQFARTKRIRRLAREALDGSN